MLADIGERSGLALALDAYGSCAIEYDGVFEIVITACDRGEGVLLHSPIQFADLADPLAQLRRCLQLCVYGAATGGAALGLDPEGDVIVLWRRMRLSGLNSHALEQAIVAFAAAADRIRERLSHPGESDEGGDEDDHVDGDGDEQPFAFAGNAGLVRV